MRTTAEILNLKCGECSNTISNELSKLKDFKEVLIDVENSQVSYTHSLDTIVKEVQKTPPKQGYPLSGDKNSPGRKARSYVSIAIGKMGN